MTYTVEQLTELEAAIASGERKVKYQDREVEYRTLADMRSIAQQIRRELGLENKVPKRTLLAFTKGHDQPQAGA